MQSLWMILASLLFAGMAVCVKLASQHVSAGELTFWRGAVALAIVYAWTRVQGVPVATPHWRGHLWRGLFGFGSLALYFFALTALPLGTAVTLNYTSPLFLALLLVVAEGQRLRPAVIGALIAGLIGVALLLRPVFDESLWRGGLLGLGSGAIAGLAFLHVRRLGALGEPDSRTVFYFSLLTALGGLPWALAGGLRMDAQLAALVLGVGGLGALAQLAMTRAYTRGNPLVSACFSYSTVVFASLFGAILWHDALPPSSWAGTALIVGSGLIVTWQSRAAPAEQD